MMTPYERVMRAVELGEPDRVPVVPQITYTTARITGIKASEATRSAEKMAEALLAGYRRVGYDGIYVGWESSFNLVAEAMGCKLRIPEDGIPSVSESLVKEPGDIEKVRVPDPERDGRLPIYLEAIDLVAEDVGGRVPIFSYIPGPLTLAGVLRDTGKILMELITDPQLVKGLLKLTTEASRRFGLAKVEHGADIIVVADPTASSTVISPGMFEQFPFPHVRRILSSIERAGAIPSLHICGKTTPILEGMAASGAKVLELDYMVDLAVAKETVGDRVCLLGNLNPTGSLLGGTPSDVEAEAKEAIKKAASGGGFILSSGCEVPLDAPIENVRAMVRAAHKYGLYDGGG
ncbi:MAG: uroporphyrinogen decarboxylase family protein [Candidatus Bathyarchaeia archaeon]